MMQAFDVLRGKTPPDKNHVELGTRQRVKLVLRYVAILCGLFSMGLGISLTTKSDLGTSPISSVPYVLSMIFPLTFGEITFLLSLFFVSVQIILLRNAFPRLQFLQVLVGALFGFFVDLGMFLCSRLHPHIYLHKIAVLLIGSIFLAFGVYLQVVANVIINPGEGAVRTIAKKTGIRIGSVKVLFDGTLTVIALVISLAAFDSVRGIREGTLLSALLVGSIVNVIHFAASRIWITRKFLDFLV
jgi:uncharacterized membrane protein YczE